MSSGTLGLEQGGRTATLPGAWTGGGAEAGASAVAGSGGTVSNWEDATWAPDCGIQVATEPREALTELEWEACAGVEGCERLLINWPSDFGIPYQFSSIFKSAGTLLLSLHLWYEGEWRKGIFANARTPIAVWRGGTGLADCAGTFTQATARHVCLVVGKGVEQSFEAVLPLDAPAGAPVRVTRTRATTSNGCTDELFTGLSGDGGQFILQIGTGIESQIAPPPNGWVADLRPFRDLALYTVWDGDRGGVAERLGRIRADMKVLFTSGYTDNAVVHHGILDSGIAYLQKPLVPDMLARRVREVLDSPRRPPSAPP